MGAGDFEYKGDKAKTDDSHDAEGFFTVGDVGYLNEDGYLFLCDRKSDMIIAGGVNIYPAEIEGEIHDAPARRRRRGVRHPRRRHGRADQGRRRAAAPASPPTTRCARRSWSTSSGRLAKFKWPRSIDFMDELPREPTGKLLKRKLRDPYWADRETAI